MQNKKLLKLLAFANLIQFVTLTVAVAWIGKIYLVDLPNYRIYVTSLFKSNLWIGESFPVISLQTATIGNTKHTDFTETKGGLVLLFDPSSCQPCLELVLEALQHVYDRLEDPNQFPVYAISATPSKALQFSRVFKIKYTLGTLLTDEDEGYSDLFSRTPVVFLVDSHQTILQCHYPLYDKEQFTQLFFWKLVSVNLPALEVSTDGFADSPLKRLEGLSVLDVIRGHHTLRGI